MINQKKINVILLLFFISIIAEGCDRFDILFLIALPLAVYAIKYSTIGLMTLIGNLIGKNFVPSEKSIKAVEIITNDEKFLKELTTVIKEQGDFNEFIKKTEAPGGSYDLEFVIKKGFQKYSTYASDIVEKLLLTDTIQTYIETNKLSKMDIQFIGDALFIEITDEKFRKKALQNRNKFYPEMEEDFWGNTHKVSS